MRHILFTGNGLFALLVGTVLVPSGNVCPGAGSADKGKPVPKRKKATPVGFQPLSQPDGCQLPLHRGALGGWQPRKQLLNNDDATINDEAQSKGVPIGKFCRIFFEKSIDKKGLFTYNKQVTPTGVTPCGGIAQLARAFGSYPKCHRFKSSYRYHHAGFR